MARTMNAYPIGTLCSVSGCPKKVEKRGMCNPHYQRMRLGRPIDEPMRPREYESIEHMLKFNVIKTDHGFIWNAVQQRGYVLTNFGMAHRVVYEYFMGPIPEGMELDHLPDCPKNCVTVAHLTPRTKSDHAKIGWERGQFEGNGWSEAAREKRTKQDICRVCGAEYTGDIKSFYCSPVCKNKSGNDRRPKKVRDIEQWRLNCLRQKACVVCGAEFEGDVRALYCSTRCSNKVYNSRRKKN